MFDRFKEIDWVAIIIAMSAAIVVQMFFARR